MKNDRLEKFENALNDILSEYNNIGLELENLRNDNKEKTVKFKELLAKKLTNNMSITILKRYGLRN